MKYLIVVPDGAGDREIASLGGKTPLDVAKMEYTNSLAAEGEVGLVRTIPEGIAPGSDAANLSVMGYSPEIYLTGRSPLEAASMGIEMADTDVAYRANIITLEGDGPYESLLIKDHSSGDISTEEANELIELANKEFANEKMHFYTGVSYRHCLIVKDGETHYELTPPHDVLEQTTAKYLPKGEGCEFIEKIMRRSYELFKDHPVNVKRVKNGLNPANSLWIWGQGKKPAMPTLYEKYNITGSTISAVDLIKGIGIYAGLDSIKVPGATGTLHTNYEGKASYAIEEFKKGKDFVYIHIEAPDECSHQGDLDGKILSLEYIDKRIIKTVVDYLKASGEDFKAMIVPDHRTPISIRTHSAEPVPFVLYDSTKKVTPDKSRMFTEESGERGTFFNSGVDIASYFFSGQIQK